MTADVADRCRSLLLILEAPMTSLSIIDEAAGTLRSASDDLMSVAELLRGRSAAEEAPIESERVESFDLSFSSALGSALD